MAGTPAGIWQALSPMADQAGRMLGESWDALLDAMPVGVVLVRDRQIVWANGAFETLLGYARGTTIGLETASFYAHQEEYERVGREGYARIARGESYATEISIKRRDGSAFWHMVVGRAANPARIEDGSVWVFQEITWQKEAQRLAAARRHQEATVVAAIAASPRLAKGALPELAAELTEAAAAAAAVERVGVWLFDEGGTRLVCLDLFEASARRHSTGAIIHEREFQREFNVLRVSKFVDAHDAQVDPRTAGYLEGYLKPNRITSMLDAVVRSGGRIHGVLCFEHVNRPHRWESDEVAFACQLADQFALAIANQEQRRLEERNRQLQKSESLGRMAGSIAHLFNNRLQAVMLGLEVAAESLPPASGTVPVLVEAMQSARHAAEICSRMLTYLGQSRGGRERLDLSEVCRRSLATLGVSMPDGVTLEHRLPPQGPFVHAGASQLQEVLTNLVINAGEASGGSRGVVRVTVQVAAAAEIPPSGRFPVDWLPQAAPYACLEVVDTGSGIAADAIEKLFEPFYSTKFAGRGLGLPVVLGIVRELGGVVTVESRPGQGSVFRAFLPLAPEPARP